jgi:alkylated DNA repair dioxygenase AlkB
VQAEPFPPVLQRIVAGAEARIRRTVPAADIPGGWRLDTCLVNFYGDRLEGGRAIDVARVGEHRDHEPGPVASVSLGERAAFQFVTRGPRPEVVRTTWLEDGSLQVFGGWWKERLLHRVQRVEDRHGLDLPPRIEGFRTRRINLTFRHVPPADVVPFASLSSDARDDVRDYVARLADTSSHFRTALASERR